MTLRITGLSSGMDIDKMVSDLMKVQKMPVDKLKQQKQIYEWQRDGYREMNSKLLELRNTVFNMKLQSTFMAQKASSSAEDVVTATATPSAVAGTYSLQVNQLAKAASFTSSPLGAGGDTTKLLNSLTDKSFTSSSLSLQIIGEKGSTSVTVNDSDSLATFMSNINGQSSVTGIKVSYDVSLDRLFFSSTATGTGAKIQFDSASADSTKFNNLMRTLQLTGGGQVEKGATFSSGTSNLINSAGTLSIKTTIGTVNTTSDFSVIAGKTTIGDIINKINGDSNLKNAGVSAYLDKDNKLVLVRPNNSVAVQLSETNSANPIQTELGLSGALAFSTGTYMVAGQNAKVTYNGIEAQYSSNAFSINGVTFTAKKDQSNNRTIPSASIVPVNIAVNQDSDSVYNNIKSFIDKYNEIIDKINQKVTEQRYRDYLPLTDDQKNTMKDNDMKLWEDKAKSGLLRGDSMLNSALDSFRRSLSNSVSGIPSSDVSQLSQIGITTGSYQEKGKLYINETKLRDAIANKPDQVMRIFTADDGNSTADSNDGLAVRLYTTINNVMKQLNDKAGSTSAYSLVDNSLIGKSITGINTRINDINLRLTGIEERYYKQFTAMETALSKMNSQSSWLSQQFAQAPHA